MAVEGGTSISQREDEEDEDAPSEGKNDQEVPAAACTTPRNTRIKAPKKSTECKLDILRANLDGFTSAMPSSAPLLHPALSLYVQIQS